MKILAFAGSTSSTSINRELVKFVLKDFQDHEINLIDLNDFDMPVFSVDREKKGFPDEAHHFLKVIEECDAIICSLAEHNRSYSAAFKNVHLRRKFDKALADIQQEPIFTQLQLKYFSEVNQQLQELQSQLH